MPSSPRNDSAEEVTASVSTNGHCLGSERRTPIPGRYIAEVCGAVVDRETGRRGEIEIHEGQYRVACPAHPSSSLRFPTIGPRIFTCEADASGETCVSTLADRLGFTTEELRTPEPPRAERRIRLDERPAAPSTAEPSSPDEAATDALIAAHATLDAEVIMSLDADAYVEMLSYVTPPNRYLPAHSRQYVVFLSRVLEANSDHQPTLLARASHLQIFPGRKLDGMRADLIRLATRPTATERVTEQAIATLREQAAPVLDGADDPLQVVERDIRRLGYGGDLRPAKVVYLAMTTRVLPKRRGSLPFHTQVNGPAGTGKSFVTDCVSALFPANAIVKYDAGSQRVVIYDPVDFKHRVIIFGEADSIPGVAHGEEDNPAASLIRTLLQTGEAHYKVPVKDKATSAWTIQEIVKEGPTVLITTTVNRVRGEQLDSRLFALDVPDDPQQQRAALAARAAAELDGAIPDPSPALVAMQRYLQARAPIDVLVPFVRPLFDLLGRGRVDARLLRDAARLVSLIKACAILREAHRDHDTRGRIVAEFDDYQTVADLISEMYENVAGVSPKMRELVERVSRTTMTSITGLARSLNISKQAAQKRVKAAITAGWLVNAELRPGYPATLKISGEPLPHRCGLPSVEQLRAWVPREPLPRDGGPDAG